MNPKMTIHDAAHCLGRSQAFVYARLLELGHSISQEEEHYYFNHLIARQLFKFRFKAQTIVFQVLKGGTGKTSLALEFAIRAHLYGAEVLCVDLDSQGNLTQSFNKNADDVPVMIDHLVDEYSIYDSVIKVVPGIDLLPSRIENALLDEVIRDKNLSLETVYRQPLNSLKNFYDLIVIDCPPSFGQSVAAAALTADKVIAPITPDKYAVSGLNSTLASLKELEENYATSIPCQIVLNKFIEQNTRSQDVLRYLQTEPDYQGKVLPICIRLSEVFPTAALNSSSIFETVNYNDAKQDIDSLTQCLLINEVIRKEFAFKNQEFA